MGRVSGTYKFIIIIFILVLLAQGSYALQPKNETNSSSNETRTGATNNTSDSTQILSTQIFRWILLLPIFFGNLLFLSWVSRFFDKMKFCFVIFLLVAALVLILLSFLSTLEEKSSENILYYLRLMVFIIISLIIIAITYNIFSKGRNGEKNGLLIDEDELILDLHDIVRNFIVIFTGLMWPMILFYFYLNDIRYVIFYGIDGLKFPVYIIAASSIGIISYLLLSIEDTYCQLIPEYKKISIAWSYLRRISIAPFIALIGFYFINHLQNIKEVDTINDRFIFVFSFFAGVFTKTIEEWVYAWVQKLLPGNKKEDFDARTEYEVKNSEFVKILKFDEDLAYALYSAKIRTIEELATCNSGSLKKKLNFDARNLGEEMGLSVTEQKERYDSYLELQIKMYIDRAQTYLNIDKSELVTKLKMEKAHAFKLYYFANIKTLEDLKNCDPGEVHEKVCDCEEEMQELAKCEKIDFKKVYDILCWCSEENIKKLKEEAQKELGRKNKMDSSSEPINKAESNKVSTNNVEFSNEENEGPKEGK